MKERYMVVEWNNRGFIRAEYDTTDAAQFQEGLDYIMKLIHTGVDFKVQFLPFLV